MSSHVNEIAMRLGFSWATEATAAGLVAACRRHEGAGAPTEAGMKLAEWMLATPALAGVLTDRLGPDPLVRLLAGSMTPANDFVAIIEKMTDRVVTADMFERVFTPDEQPSVETEVAALFAASGTLCTIDTRFGEAAMGPLFCAIFDPITPRDFVLEGFGMALRLDAARATAMRVALTDGLAKIEARG